ncbi:hypothetical protein AN964_10430 [Heyndrickxia shackletonii]|uniref:Uncharacterized protein n=1 Tax=Heyndrickxia shackletonii TaxID=157838 RepID=A0A0Q3WXK1_9BACI|nr:hypothetical protein AN964_10430 [Heyndrickxia shackletonii]
MELDHVFSNDNCLTLVKDGLTSTIFSLILFASMFVNNTMINDNKLEEKITIRMNFIFFLSIKLVKYLKVPYKKIKKKGKRINQGNKPGFPLPPLATPNSLFLTKGSVK